MFQRIRVSLEDFRTTGRRQGYPYTLRPRLALQAEAEAYLTSRGQGIKDFRLHDVLLVLECYPGLHCAESGARSITLISPGQRQLERPVSLKSAL